MVGDTGAWARGAPAWLPRPGPHPAWARSSLPERIPHPLSGGIPFLLTVEPKGQAVPRGGELPLPAHSGLGRWARRQSRGERDDVQPRAEPPATLSGPRGGARALVWSGPSRGPSRAPLPLSSPDWPDLGHRAAAG